MKQHMPMTTLSEREKILVRNFLNQAYQEGGRGLWLVAKKFVTVSYLYHILTYEGRTTSYTLWNVINKVRDNTGNIETKLRYEVTGIYNLLDDNQPLWNGRYKLFTIRTIMDKKMTSIRQFHHEMLKFIETAAEEKRTIERLGMRMPKPEIDTDIPDMPF